MPDESFFTLAVHAGEDRSEITGLSQSRYITLRSSLPDADEGAAIHNEEKPGYYYGRPRQPDNGCS